MVHTKRYIVRIHYVRYGERQFPQRSKIDRMFGSRESHRVQVGTTLDGKPIYRTTHPAVTMTAHEVLALLQREIRRAGVDRVTVLVV